MSEVEKKWYALRVISGKEKKLSDLILREIKRSGWEHIISQVLVPTEKVYKIQGGKKVIKEKNFFPGYILIEAYGETLNSEVISAIVTTNGVIHFLGKENPTPLRTNEVNRILGKVDEMEEFGTGVVNEPFIINETVKITDGPFNNFTGTIEEVNDEKKKLKVVVKIFGRKTPVELNFMQVEKTS
ncbi:MAG: transcription termination/antitermination factor NusG [Chitinophagaceae bacterium]|nr:MAG: transcription termination/antitermination factor NusG [Chitinophagaceae bacterium]